jgi:hypothetical protein
MCKVVRMTFRSYDRGYGLRKAKAWEEPGCLGEKQEYCKRWRSYCSQIKSLRDEGWLKMPLDEIIMKLLMEFRKSFTSSVYPEGLCHGCCAVPPRSPCQDPGQESRTLTAPCHLRKLPASFQGNPHDWPGGIKAQCSTPKRG